MGAVYLAHDTQLDRPVALKMPHFTADDGPQVLARFYREARSAATVTHPNVCPVYDVGEIDGIPYLTMAFIEGKSLAEFIRAKPLTPRQAAMLVRKLALALQEAHKKGVIHRDLKPANIMIDQRGEPVVMDFGLARRNRPGDVRLTQKGAVMGTPAYMPPEQVSGKAEVMGPPCDIYSLGVLLYELVAGRLPFSGDPMAVLSQVLLDEPPPPSRFRADLDAGLERICLKAMAKKIEDRYGSMTELAAALQEYLRSGSATGIVKPTPKGADSAAEDGADWHTLVQPEAEPSRIIMAERKPARRPSKRGYWFWVGIAGGAVTLCGAFVLVFLLWPKSRVTSAAPKTAPPIRREPSFVPLFNGKDLSGWETASGDPAVWRIEETVVGQIRVDGDPTVHPMTMFATIFTLNDSPRQRGWLLTERDYTDFLLRLKFQIVTPGSQSGIGLRMWPGSPKPLKIPIQDETFPAFAAHPPAERTGALYGVAGSPGAGVGLNALHEWNHMEIESRGWHLRVLVNGKATLETRLNDDKVFRYLDGAPPASGRIGLQHWLGSVRFRDLEIKDLSGLDDAVKRENP
jgi:hypothetical protein